MIGLLINTSDSTTSWPAAEVSDENVGEKEVREGERTRDREVNGCIGERGEGGEA